MRGAQRELLLLAEELDLVARQAELGVGDRGGGGQRRRVVGGAAVAVRVVMLLLLLVRREVGGGVLARVRMRAAVRGGRHWERRVTR